METNKKGTKKSTGSRRQYDSDFKKSAVELIKNGQSVPQVSQSLGIVESLLYKWKAEQTGDTRPPSTWEKSESEVEKELLRGKIKQLERDILKKALDIFSRVN